MTPIHPDPNAAVVAKAPILVLSSDCVAYQHLEPCLFESVADRRLFVARCPADAELAELEPVRVTSKVYRPRPRNTGTVRDSGDP